MRNFVFLALALTFCASSALSEQILPENLHSMPVLIEVPLPGGMQTSTGTGVFLSASNKVFLVTAAHCIFNVLSTNKSELLNSNAVISSLYQDKDGDGKNAFFLDLKQLSDNGLIRRHPAHDVTVIQVFSMAPLGTNGPVLDLPVAGVQLASRPWTVVTYAASEVALSFTNIPDGSETYILGYPVELLKDPTASEVDFSYPLIRRGIVSQRNRQTGKLIIDSGVYGGNSGGPVLVVRQPSIGEKVFYVAGIITQFVPVTTRVWPNAGITNSVLVNSGYGVAESIDYAIELMAQCKP